VGGHAGEGENVVEVLVARVVVVPNGVAAQPREKGLCSCSKPRGAVEARIVVVGTGGGGGGWKSCPLGTRTLAAAPTPWHARLNE